MTRVKMTLNASPFLSASPTNKVRSVASLSRGHCSYVVCVVVVSFVFVNSN